MWPLKTIMYFILFWAGCVLALVNPIWGVINYMMAYQTNPTDTWWGLPLTALGLRFSMLAAVFTAIGLFTGRRNVPKIRPSFSAWEWGLLGLVVIAALNLFTGWGYNENSQYAFEKFWKMMLFALILSRLTSSRHNLKLVLWAFVAGSLYIGYDAYTAPPSAFWLGRLERIGGPDFATTSGAAAHLSAMLPLIGTAFLISPNWRWRAFAAVSAAFTVNAIVLCRTRSAFIGLFCGAVAALLMAPRVWRHRIHLMLVTGAVLAFSLTDSHFWTRMNTMSSRESLEKDAAAVSRTEIWKVSLEILADYPLGIGPGNFPTVVGTYDSRYYKRSSHNTIVVCMTEFGVQGGLLFLTLVGGSIVLLYRTSRLARNLERSTETKLLAYGMLVSLCTYFVTGLGTERFYCESYWWIMILPLCLHRIAVRELALETEPCQLEPLGDEEEPFLLTGALRHEF